MGVNRVAIVGVQTPNCVRGTAMDALSLDFEVAVLEDATASQTSQVQVANLFDMRYAGIETPSTAEWIAELEKLKSPQV
ncbi:hypothetical protein H632_c675p0 [Helicosporidium sp. ATCC 50920]|nr:hypothetical protein H632_c675p0 [Helicosporidium sp. ATCC 50920]|eukprot:KDD75457.1 hypothetical protein H632_c675p0 [Helicosporidium sp. ATCC 50920]